MDGKVQVSRALGDITAKTGTQDPRPHVDAGGHDHRGSGDHRVPTYRVPIDMLSRGVRHVPDGMGCLHFAIKHIRIPDDSSALRVASAS